MSRNGTPSTSPMSIERSRPAVKASRAPTTSWRSTPRSRAKWLRVPAGTQTKGRPCADATAATTAIEPSPPATPSASAPRSTASVTKAARSWPGWRMTGSIPSSRARRSSDSRVAVPPPERGLMNSTAWSGRATGCQPIASCKRAVGRVARRRASPSQGPPRRDGDRREGGAGDGSRDDVCGVVHAGVDS